MRSAVDFIEGRSREARAKRGMEIGSDAYDRAQEHSHNRDTRWQECG